MEPEVYAKLVPEKKALSDLDQKMHKILASNRLDSAKITLYNEALQKSNTFLKKIQPKTSARKPLSENAVLKQYKKHVRAKKLLKDATSKKNLDWDDKDCMILDNRVVAGLKIDDLFQSALKKEILLYPAFTSSNQCYGRVFRLLRPKQKRLFFGSSMLSKAVVAIARHLHALQTGEKKIQMRKNDRAWCSLSNASRPC